MIDSQSVIHRAEHLIDASFAESVEKHADEFAEKLINLRKAVESGSRKRIRQSQQIVLKSYSAKLCCLVLVADKNDYESLTPSVLSDIAENLDAYADSGETVSAYAKIKSIRGDWRPICKFGPRRKALQTLLSFLLAAKFGTHPLDYMARGRGCEVAADRITQFLDDGIRFFVVADIEACFRSVKHEAIAPRLGLPPAVVQHCLLIGEDTHLQLPSNLPNDTTHKAFREAVRQGLPQGARSSNLVASLLLGPELGSMTSGYRVTLYGDDIAVPAATLEEARMLVKILPGLFEAHPAGPFRLKRMDMCSADEGFNYLKYRFKRDPHFHTTKVRPSDLSYFRFSERVREIISIEPTKRVYSTVMTYLKRWLLSFRRYVANEIAINLLRQSSIDSLPFRLHEKWEASCKQYVKSCIWPPGKKFIWID